VPKQDRKIQIYSPHLRNPKQTMRLNETDITAEWPKGDLWRLECDCVVINLPCLDCSFIQITRYITMP